MSLLAREWLIDQPTARVLHVFDRSCCLIAADGRLLTLVAQGKESGPFSIAIGQHQAPDYSSQPFFAAVNVNSVISCDPGTLHIGRMRISTESAEVWDPRLSKGLLVGRSTERGMQSVRRLADRLAPSRSLAWMLHGVETGPIEDRISRAWQAMRSGFSCQDPEVVAAGARLAAGAGIGLTPSGDDFLLGVLVALWLYKVNPEPFLSSIVSSAASRTNTLSAAWLKAAGQGNVGQVWHCLAAALYQGDEEEIVSAGRRVLQVGSTSGADALAGFILAMEQLVRNANSSEVGRL